MFKLQRHKIEQNGVWVLIFSWKNQYKQINRKKKNVPAWIYVRNRINSKTAESKRARAWVQIWFQNATFMFLKTWIHEMNMKRERERDWSMSELVYILRPPIYIIWLVIFCFILFLALKHYRRAQSLFFCCSQRTHKHTLTHETSAKFFFCFAFLLFSVKLCKVFRRKIFIAIHNIETNRT